MKNNTGELLIRYTLIIVVAFAIAIGIIPSVIDYQAKNRMYESMDSSLNDMMSSNINLINVDEHDGGTAYGVGSSGVIIGKSNNRYYALTACHVVTNHDEIDYWRVMSYGDPSIWEYKKEHEGSGLEDYYSHFPKIKIEYIKPEYDLAVVSFQSDKELKIASVAKENPVKGNQIAIVSNPEGEKFVKSYGKIKSGELETFSADNDLLPSTLVLKHNAYEAPGSSGSAVFDGTMQLIGINIGGGTDLFGRFRYGVMVPAEQINKCISEVDCL